MTYLKTLGTRLKTLAVFRNILSDSAAEKLCALLGAGGMDAAEKAELWGSFSAELYTRGGNLTWHFLSLVLDDDNAYVRSLAKGEASACIIDSAKRELAALQEASELKPEDLRKHLGMEGQLPCWDTEQADFAAEYDRMINELPVRGWGKFRRHGMFRLKDGKPEPVLWPDTVRLADLKGYERERAAVIENTLALLEGRPAANALLYGDAGTGKSSTVKAIVNEYMDRGLRLIEVPKKQAGDIPALAESLAGNPLKFIIFIDDLSFARENDEFYALKAVLEGSASAKSGNIVIYATSNRRHLIRESFSDRQGDDVHRDETIQETVSLSARFGLVVGFLRPNKDLYLRIVGELSCEYGIEMENGKLELEAERFASMGRSPRAARQFIESLAREKGLKNE